LQWVDGQNTPRPPGRKDRPIVTICHLPGKRLHSDEDYADYPKAANDDDDRDRKGASTPPAALGKCLSQDSPAGRPLAGFAKAVFSGCKRLSSLRLSDRMKVRLELQRPRENATPLDETRTIF
jgi:hypothetical protein